MGAGIAFLVFPLTSISHFFEGQGHSILNRPALNIFHLDQRYKVVKFLNTSCLRLFLDIPKVKCNKFLNP